LAFIFYFNDHAAFGPGKDIMTQVLFETHDQGISVWLLISRFFTGFQEIYFRFMWIQISQGRPVLKNLSCTGYVPMDMHAGR